MFSDSAVLFCVVVNMVKINTYLILIPYTYRVRLQNIIKDLANREGAIKCIKDLGEKVTRPRISMLL